MSRSPPACVSAPSAYASLGPEDLDEDLRALRESDAQLQGLFDEGPWPVGITRDDNLIDLCWHRREFTSRRSYAWVIADGASDAYLGCAYVYPGFSPEGPLRAVWWFRTSRRAEGEGFPRLFLDWLASPPWPSLPVNAPLTTR